MGVGHTRLRPVGQRRAHDRVPTPADPSQTHAEAIAWARKGCSVKISSDWPLLESQIFGLCVREKGYGSVQFAPQQGQEPLGTFNLTGLTEMVLAGISF